MRQHHNNTIKISVLTIRYAWSTEERCLNDNSMNTWQRMHTVQAISNTIPVVCMSYRDVIQVQLTQTQLHILKQYIETLFKLFDIDVKHDD